jgi:hypothetical protein
MSSPVIVLQAGVLCPAFTTTTNGQTGIRQAVGKILFLGISSDGFYKFYSSINQSGAFEMWWLHGPPFHHFQALPLTSSAAQKLAENTIKTCTFSSTGVGQEE